MDWFNTPFHGKIDEFPVDVPLSTHPLRRLPAFRCQSESLRELELADGDTVVVVPPRVGSLGPR